MVIVESKTVYVLCEVVSLIKGRFLGFYNYSEDIFVNVKIKTDTLNKDIPDTVKNICSDLSQYSEYLYVPKSLSGIIREHWENNRQLFLSFDILEKDKKHLIYQIASCLTLTRIDA